MTLVFFVEGPSEKELLDVLIPKLVPEGVVHEVQVFQGKQDLEAKLVRRIRAWRTPGTHFVVLRDQDSAGCTQVKSKLAGLCAQAGRPDSLVRVACRELESWYLGDLHAVEQGLGLKGLAELQGKTKFRDPDRLGSPSAELKRLTKGSYQKLAGSRTIAPHLDLAAARSNSFRVFVEGIRRIAGAGGGA